VCQKNIQAEARLVNQLARLIESRHFDYPFQDEKATENPVGLINYACDPKIVLLCSIRVTPDCVKLITKSVVLC
jgi:hypothetical protein